MNKLLEPTKEMIEAGQIAGNLQYAKVIRSYEAMISKSETIPKLLAVVEVLKFYAKPETYESETLDGVRTTYTYPIEKDRGRKAREALKDLEG